MIKEITQYNNVNLSHISKMFIDDMFVIHDKDSVFNKQTTIGELIQYELPLFTINKSDNYGLKGGVYVYVEHDSSSDTSLTGKYYGTRMIFNHPKHKIDTTYHYHDNSANKFIQNSMACLIWGVMSVHANDNFRGTFITNNNIV